MTTALNRFGRRTTILLVLQLALLTGCAGAPPAQSGGAAGESWSRTELYFGMGKPDGGLVSQAQWLDFLDAHVVPRFPDGLTALNADGRYLDSHHVLRREPSRLVILLYPRAQAAEADRKIKLIAGEYATMFQQESVLRADGVNRVSFLSETKPEAAAGDAVPRASK